VPKNAFVTLAFVMRYAKSQRDLIILVKYFVKDIRNCLSDLI